MAWYDDPKQTFTVKEYGNRGAMERDMRKAGERGWDVVSTTSKTKRQFWKLILGLIGYFIWTTTGFVVTFRRQESASPSA